MEIFRKDFYALDVPELYELLALRTDVFVVEQKCAYAELDHHDQKAIHLMGWQDGKLIACARVAAPFTVYEQPSIGRVAVKEEFRGKGFGHQIFEQALKSAAEQFPGKEIKLQAQVYLKDFYTAYGFNTISEPYLDFGIWHVDMEKELR